MQGKILMPCFLGWTLGNCPEREIVPGKVKNACYYLTYLYKPNISRLNT